MAKKGQAIQLQTEVNNDEDWEKLLQRDGLIVVDVYSEWCGPCSGMTATLKKLKLEIGGDVLQLAIAKADKITALERFRNKSEPTWMFIINGKMVNFMFGANAPKLTRLITEELRKENEARQGRRDRVQNEISDITEEERERLDVVERQRRAAKEKEEAKAAKELFERRTAECHKILETLQHMGIILIFPHAKTSYQEAFGDLLGEAGLTISQTEKVDLTEQILDELFYFGEMPFPEEALEELLNNTCMILQVKPIPARDVEEPTDELILQILYGPSKKPPGSSDCPARVLAKLPEPSEEEVHEKTARESVGVWAPENELIKATALRLFFHKLTEHYLIPEPEPTPPHYAVVFEAMRRHEIASFMEKYSDQVIRYGFFTSERPEEAKLVAKSIYKYERSPDRTPNEKMVIQLAKKKSECVLAFAQLKPLYISPNIKEGERECRLFFGDDYDEPPEEEEIEEQKEVPATPKSKSEQASVLDQDIEGSQVVALEEGEIVEGVPEEGAEAVAVAEEGAPLVGEVPPAEGEAPPAEGVPPETEPSVVVEPEASPPDQPENVPETEAPPPAETTEAPNAESPP
ncbi:fibrous sheath CABYR-binding protein-like [Tribolium castaneum]|uniref:fibrous sheath CABYR-binding protein-like n=1 Tax=Tribolium castaneum TaxID=7070 RepID=UPI0000D56225|nr:PREDICTED: fibrous sheath CABYR-binding protein [Tribolium castaneum]|eukprot:XP_015836128.1 PREDICTED: fibrous sheath CABYR-binding protein [Tribolium castaneum]